MIHAHREFLRLREDPSRVTVKPHHRSADAVFLQLAAQHQIEESIAVQVPPRHGAAVQPGKHHRVIRGQRARDGGPIPTGEEGAPQCQEDTSGPAHAASEPAVLRAHGRLPDLRRV